MDSNAEPTVERMRPLDAPDVAKVSAACFDRPWTAHDLKLEPARRGALCLLARAQGVAVGYVLMRAVLDESELLSIGVLPTMQGRGVARSLLKNALVLSRAEGVERVHLEVRADNAAATALYRRAGFEEVGRRPGYYADGVDARLMTWAATGRTPPPPRG